ncbi:uncharacterized protein LOC135843797 [Planococcus citri]|uniref:uncharacterized protein LOC135843797 n=1 Tax=Planococcus citri TaxID=170843 RepID=UPI0031F9F6D0
MAFNNPTYPLVGQLPKPPSFMVGQLPKSPSLMAPTYTDDFTRQMDDFAGQITDLETEISKQQICAIEAKVFYDHLKSIYKKISLYEEIQMTKNLHQPMPRHHFTNSNTFREIYSRVITLKIKLEKILFSKETKADEDESNSNKKQSESAKNLDSQIKKQNFLINKIESLKIVHGDISSTKAEIIYSHLFQLYDLFIANQMQIEASVDGGVILDNQQKIATEIQWKVIDFQTKLKEIMKLIAPTSSNESEINIDHSTRPSFKDAAVNLKSFMNSSNQFKKTSQSEQTQSSELESTLQSIQLKLSNLESLYNDLLDSQPDRNEIGCNFSDIFTYLVDILEVSKEIESKMAFLEEKQQQFVDDDDLDEIMAENNHQKQNCRCIKCDPIRGNSMFLCARNLVQEMHPPIPPVPIGLRRIDIKSTSTDPSALNMAQLTSSNSNPSDQGSSKVVPPQSGDHRKFKKYGKTKSGAFKFS